MALIVSKEAAALALQLSAAARIGLRHAGWTAWSVVELFLCCIDLAGCSELFGAERSLLWVWAPARWLRAMYSMRGLRSIGPRLIPIVYAVLDSGVFLLFLSMLIAGSVHAHFALGTAGMQLPGSAFGPLFASFLPMFQLGVMGGVDLWHLGDFNAVENRALVVVFLVTALLVSTAVMNLFIGVLGESFDRHEDSSEPLLTRARARMILAWRAWPFLARWMDRTAPEELWVAARSVVSLEDMRSSRTVAHHFHDTIREEVKAASRRQDEVVTDLKQRQDEMLQRQDEMSQRQNEMLQRLDALQVQQAAMLAMMQRAFGEPARERASNGAGALDV